MWNQASAIVWAQWRSTRNHFPRANLGGMLFTGLLTTVWYGAFAYLAVLAGILLSQPAEVETFHKILPAALLVCFLYWQVIPVLLTSMGASLARPCPAALGACHHSLFGSKNLNNTERSSAIGVSRDNAKARDGAACDSSRGVMCLQSVLIRSRTYVRLS